MQQVKDYYKILGIRSDATPQDIKQSYRKLAHKYHPDKNPDNQHAAAHFKEILEAYSVLSNQTKRRKYDEVCWLSGMGKRMYDEPHISPQWILQECVKLSAHMRTLDTYRMSHRALHDYIMLILSDQHMAILHDHPENNQQIVQEILNSTKRVVLKYAEPIVKRLSELAGDNAGLQTAISEQLRTTKIQEKRGVYLPWIVVIMTLLLCVVMFFYGRK
jgi:hypothetical protein